MKTAAELRKSLAGLPEDQIDEIVKRQVEAGNVTDEDGDGESITMADARKVAEELRKSMDLDPPEDFETNDEPPEVDDNGYLDVYATLEHFAKAADGLVERQEAYTDYTTGQVEVLQKAWLAGLELTKELVAQNNQLSAMVKSQGERLDAIASQLGAPIPPRSVTGNAAAIPSPGEQAAEEMAKGGADVRDKVINAIHAKMATSKDQQEKMYLLEASARIDTGADPMAIAKSYHIDIATA